MIITLYKFCSCPGMSLQCALFLLHSSSRLKFSIVDFRLRLRKDIRTLFANHSVCNASKLQQQQHQEEDSANGSSQDSSGKTNTGGSATTSEKKKAFLCKSMIYDENKPLLNFIHDGF